MPASAVLPVLSLEGCVLASRNCRTDADPAALRFGGGTLWEHQQLTLLEVGASPVRIVRGPGQPVLAPNVPHLFDVFAGTGPLGGVHAALAAANKPWVAVLGVDMPGIDAAWFRWLAAQLSTGTGVVASRHGRLETLAAIYPRSALPQLTLHLQRGGKSLHDCVAELATRGVMDVVNVPRGWEWRSANCRSPEELARIFRGRRKSV